MGESGARPDGRAAGANGEAGMVKTVEVAKTGISLGTALAVAMSWTANKSIIWAIVHGLLSWIYVVYYALMKQ
jgi:hypothetical protein